MQGVGFRPLAVRLARERGLAGWVRNSSCGVMARVSGSREDVVGWMDSIASRLVGGAWIERSGITAATEERLPTPFAIWPSEVGGCEVVPMLSPDLAICPECAQEIEDPTSRRFRYSFTSCAHCGPRFSILESLPFDRERTAMRIFPLCPDCLAEYTDPSDRRFHAQAVACPVCGPRLSLIESTGQVVRAEDAALREAGERLLDGQILAVQGVGGFHLMVRADSQEAVLRLRLRKHRPSKPLAVMVQGIRDAEEWARICDIERRELLSCAAPIVLLEPRANTSLASAIAPNVPTLGLLLASTPLHLLLLGEVGVPLVATSGNLSEEPICIEPAEAVQRLAQIADAFLVNDRPIRRPLDDSIVRVIAGRPMLLRRGRGYAPSPLRMAASMKSGTPFWGAGGHLKSAFAVSVRGRIIPAAHVGDLDHPLARDAFAASVADAKRLFVGEGDSGMVCDLHPDYASTDLVNQASGVSASASAVSVQHHHAHAAAVAAEHGLSDCLGIVWDGTGLGPDGTIWGGEFLELRGDGTFIRRGWLRPFRLPGGEQAMREPSRSAVGVMGEMGLDPSEAIYQRMGISPSRFRELVQLLRSERVAPSTTSAGRLFDAAAALLGCAPARAYEGQAAMALEALGRGVSPSLIACSLDASPNGWILDWSPLLRWMCEVPDPAHAAATFHASLAEAAARLCEKLDLPDVVLSGGCMQNKMLVEYLHLELDKRGKKVYTPVHLPPNDGGLAVGQLVVAQQKRISCA